MKAADKGAGGADGGGAEGGAGAPGGPGDRERPGDQVGGPGDQVGGPGDRERPGDAGGPGDREGPGDAGGWEFEGCEGGASGEAPQAEGTSQAPGQGEEAQSLAPASASSGGSGHEEFEFTLTVPFRSILEAGIARHYLGQGYEYLVRGVRRELTITGSDLVIRLTSHNSDILRLSVILLLNHLAMMIQAMHHFIPPRFPQHHGRKGG
nr:EKC/KEOPS complex subunit LAGE3-like [Aotus nancymaae]XP_021524504.1 EKC/KEOPS complex subunit LAGE3-like [Aotus nancymaae]